MVATREIDHAARLIRPPIWLVRFKIGIGRTTYLLRNLLISSFESTSWSEQVSGTSDPRRRRGSAAVDVPVETTAVMQELGRTGSRPEV